MLCLTMNRQDLIRVLADRCSDVLLDSQFKGSAVQKRAECRRNAEYIVDNLFDIITKQVAEGYDVRVDKFGTFTSMVTKPTRGFDPNIRQMVDIPSKRVPKLRPHKALKDAVDVKK